MVNEPGPAALLALDVAIDRLRSVGGGPGDGSSGSAGSGSSVPGGNGPTGDLDAARPPDRETAELLAVARWLAELPARTWDEVAPIHPSVDHPIDLPAHPPADHLNDLPARRAPDPRSPGAPAARSHRHWHHRVAHRGLLAVAAVVVVLAVAAGVGALFANGGPSGPSRGTRWQVAGYLHQAPWQSVLGANAVYSLTATCPGPSTCYLADPGTRAIKVTNDGGSHWSTVDLPQGSEDGSALACAGPRACAVATRHPAVLFTADGGATWRRTAVPAGVVGVAELTCSSPTACVAIGSGPATPGTPSGPALALRTTDGGATWSVSTVPSPFIASSRHGLSCPGAGRCVTAGVVPDQSIGAVRFSTDGGATWSASTLPPGVAYIHALACPDATDCLALGNGLSKTRTGDPYGPTQVLRSTDGGRTWTRGATDIGGGVTAESLACPTPLRCWAVGKAYATPEGVVLGTTDGGATWSGARLPAHVQFVIDISCHSASACLAVGGAVVFRQPTPVGVVLRGPG